MSIIVKAEAYHISLPIKFEFKTSFGVIKQRDTIIIKLTTDDGIVGWGESAPLTEPIYLEETIGTCKHVIKDFLFPIILGKLHTPEEFVKATTYIRGNRIAKYGIECALWTIQSQIQNLPITQLIKSKRKTVEIGESVGMLDNIENTIHLIEKRVLQGYKRIKLKISPGHDLNLVKKVRTQFPNLNLMVDANSAYTLKDINIFKKLDKYELMMIEQPLGFDDIIDHAKLQRKIKTPICLDESIVSYESASKAIEIGACKIINIKAGRIGSLWETIRINKLAKNKVKLWCGGMLEAGIANTFNMYAASLSEFSLPADIFVSDKMFYKDIISTEIRMSAPGVIEVPQKIGLGYEVDENAIGIHTVEEFGAYCG
jgi:O-succinylbenzoate synthase